MIKNSTTVHKRNISTPLLDSLVERARELNGPLIIVEGSHDYLGLLLNFAESVRRTRGMKGLRELVVITLDEGLATVLPPHVQTVPLLPLVREVHLDINFWTQKYFLSFLWATRVRLIAALLDRGVSVLMNDVDAIWLKDPIEEMFNELLPDTDIIAQRGTMPTNLGFRYGSNAGKWGSTLCMGFIYFKSNIATRQLMKAANHLQQPTKLQNHRTHLEKYFDDQKWINYLLYDAGIKWPEVERGDRISYVGRRAETTIGHVDKLGLRVALLSPNLVSRLCKNRFLYRNPRVVVEHCHVIKSKDKSEVLRVRKIWYLKGKWSPKGVYGSFAHGNATWVKRRRRACTPLLPASKHISLLQAQCFCTRVKGCVGVARMHDIGAAITRDSIFKFELCNATTRTALANRTVYVLSVTAGPGHKHERQEAWAAMLDLVTTAEQPLSDKPCA